MQEQIDLLVSMGMGIAPIEAMRRAGLTVALGTDGTASPTART